jgi:hypothetical protein
MTKGNRKRTPEERARWRENQERLERVLQKALTELGTTRDELHAKVGLPRPPRTTH